MPEAFTHIMLFRLIAFVVIVYIIAKRIKEKRVYWHFLAFLVLAVALNTCLFFGIFKFWDPIAIAIASAIFVIAVIGSIIEKLFVQFLVYIVLVASIVTIGYFIPDLVMGK